MTRAAAPDVPAVNAAPFMDAASVAPDAPGIYCFLSAKHELLYVGKAISLRRRLAQHANDALQPGGRRAGSLYRRAVEVRWETVADDDAACAREADLIVALQPPYNAMIAGEGCWAYVITTPLAGNIVRFTVSADAGSADGRVYGCFPHLGVGVSSRPAITCSDGYVALLRLLWIASGARGYIPRRIGAGSPPERFDVAVDPAMRVPLHAFLSGTSRELLRQLSGVRTPGEPLLERVRIQDLATAVGFFSCGAKAIRALRLRHRLGPGAVSQAQFEAAMIRELQESIGEFWCGH